MSSTISVQELITGNVITNTVGYVGSQGSVGESSIYTKIEQIVSTDENFTNLSPLSSNVKSSGGFIKILGKNFESNSKLYVSSGFTDHNEIQANIVSANEIRANVTTPSVGSYNLFLINPSGFNLTKINAFNSTKVNFGLWSGGLRIPGSVLSSTERINYDSDTSTALARGPLSASKRSFAASGNEDYGWFGGGRSQSPSASSTIDRLNYNNDTETASVRGFLTVASLNHAATGNNNFAWFGGGYSGVPLISNVQRLDYGIDTNDTLVRGPLTQSRGVLSSSGNLHSAWFVGGWAGSFPANRSSTVNRIFYDNDTGLTSVRGPLSIGRLGLTANGNENYGWVVSGYIYTPTFTILSTIDRISYASDTSTASNRSISSNRVASAASGDTDYGWWAGGLGASGVDISSVIRVNYSNDTGVLNFRGPLIDRRYTHAAAGGFPG
jgi:hypothetical protein